MTDYQTTDGCGNRHAGIDKALESLPKLNMNIAVILDRMERAPKPISTEQVKLIAHEAAHAAVKEVQKSDKDDWGDPPFPHAHPPDTKEIVRVARGVQALLALVTKYSAAIAVILSALGVWGVNAAGNTSAPEIQEESQEGGSTEAVDRFTEIVSVSD